MAVSVWAVLGVILTLIGLPLVVVSPDSPFSYAVGAGVAFLIVAASQQAWESWGKSRDPDLDPGDAPSLRVP